MSINAAVVEQLKRFANVAVYVGERESIVAESISISPVKLSELAAMYEKVYTFTHTIWRNLPAPPDCEPAFVMVWMIAAENYDVNHLTVSWTGTSANMFVHLWSTVDRLRTTIDTMTASWLLGSRGPVGYANHTRMPGAADMHLYPKEIATLPHIEVLTRSANECTGVDLNEEFTSFYDFRQSMMMPKKTAVMDVSAMILRNADIARAAMYKDQ